MGNEEYISEIIKYVNKEHAMTKYMNDFIEKIIKPPYTKEYQILCNAIFCFITNDTSTITSSENVSDVKENIKKLEEDIIQLAIKPNESNESTKIETIEQAKSFAVEEKANAIKTIEDITTKVLQNQMGGSLLSKQISPLNLEQARIKAKEKDAIQKANEAIQKANEEKQQAKRIANEAKQQAKRIAKEKLQEAKRQKKPEQTSKKPEPEQAPAQTVAPELELAQQPPAAEQTENEQTANGPEPKQTAIEHVKEAERNKQQENISTKIKKIQENISTKIKKIQENSLETFIKDNAELLQSLLSAKNQLDLANQIEEKIRDLQELKQIQELKEKLKEEQISKDTLRNNIIKKLEGMKDDIKNLVSMKPNLEKKPLLETVFKGVPPEKLYLSYYIINNYK